ncbi:MAG: ABC transporter ATP-binding protein, partial [Lachnospiraceae bacterium]|nr:ABC transporter ATP-binding protein [Lachnospiraceae bacterium]
EIDKVLKLVRMEDQLDKKVREYSLGMKQRLGLAEALLGSPALLILDEPTNGLDPAGISEIRELIRELPERMGMTVLVSSHLLGEMDQMADYVGIINHGQLIFQDKLEVLHEHSRGSLRLCAMNQAAALRVLKREGISCTLKEGALELPRLSDDATARLIDLLSGGGAGVYRVEEKQKSLEEIFLSLTGRRGSL